MCKTYTPENSELLGLPSAMFVGSTGRVWLGMGYSESMSIFDGNTFINYGAEAKSPPNRTNIDFVICNQVAELRRDGSTEEVFTGADITACAGEPNRRRF